MNIKNLGGAPSLAARAFRTPPPPQNLSNRRRATQLRRTAAAIAAALLFAIGNTAFAQTQSITLTAAEDEQAGFTATYAGLDMWAVYSLCRRAADGDFTPIAGEANTGITSSPPEFPPLPTAFIDTATDLPPGTYDYQLRVVLNSADVTALAGAIQAVVLCGDHALATVSNVVTRTIAAASGDAADDAVLPNVLRQQHRGIHNGIFRRIQQRQRQDGRWK